MLLGMLFFSILSFFLGIVLSYTSYKCRFNQDPLVKKINELLPQTQCAQCGYLGCYPYAVAMVKNGEEINKCIPGGTEMILKISEELNLKKNKLKKIIVKEKIFDTTVWIDEKNCVGCSKCAHFCPVDAIVGAPNFSHTVLQKFCTGCNICITHCPTDCIKIIKRPLCSIKYYK